MAYQGKHTGRSSCGRRHKSHRAVVLVLAMVLLTSAFVGTLAYLTDKTTGVTNTFSVAEVPNVPVEEFEGTTKSSITVKNEGNIDVYIRVKLVTYRVDDQGNHIGGIATIPAFTLGDNWFELKGYYYYKLAVKPEKFTGNLIATNSKIELQKYTDADGGKQVIEVISESIQSLPDSAVEAAWTDVSVQDGKLTATGGSAQ